MSGARARPGRLLSLTPFRPPLLHRSHSGRAHWRIERSRYATRSRGSRSCQSVPLRVRDDQRPSTVSPCLTLFAWFRQTPDYTTPSTTSSPFSRSTLGSRTPTCGLVRPNPDGARHPFRQNSRTDDPSPRFSVAGVTAVEAMGGPTVPWVPGRTDYDDEAAATDHRGDVGARLPDAALGADHIRQVFGRSVSITRYPAPNEDSR